MTPTVIEAIRRRNAFRARIEARARNVSQVDETEIDPRVCPRRRAETERMIAEREERRRAAAEEARRRLLEWIDEQPRTCTDEVRRVMGAIARAFDVPVTALTARSQNRAHSTVRQAAMWAAYQIWPGSPNQLARIIKRDRTTILDALPKVERRIRNADDPIRTRERLREACRDERVSRAAAERILEKMEALDG